MKLLAFLRFGYGPVAVGTEVGLSMVWKSPFVSLTRGASITPTDAKGRFRLWSTLPSTTFLKFRIYHSSRGTDFVGPGVDDGIAVEVVDEGHQSFAEFAF
jgi:hypothetical protein